MHVREGYEIAAPKLDKVGVLSGSRAFVAQPPARPPATDDGRARALGGRLPAAGRAPRRARGRGGRDRASRARGVRGARPLGRRRRRERRRATARAPRAREPSRSLAEAAPRCAGRVDVRLGGERDGARARAARALGAAAAPVRARGRVAEQLVVAAARRALGDDAVLAYAGLVLSLPGSATQPWHADGPHLFGLRPAAAGARRRAAAACPRTRSTCSAADRHHRRARPDAARADAAPARAPALDRAAAARAAASRRRRSRLARLRRGDVLATTTARSTARREQRPAHAAHALPALLAPVVSRAPQLWRRVALAAAPSPRAESGAEADARSGRRGQPTAGPETRAGVARGTPRTPRAPLAGKFRRVSPVNSRPHCARPCSRRKKRTKPRAARARTPRIRHHAASSASGAEPCSHSPRPYDEQLRPVSARKNLSVFESTHAHTSASLLKEP